MGDRIEGQTGIRVERLKEARVWMSILGAMVVGGYSGFHASTEAYRKWHDDRYVLKSEALTLAQAAAIEDKVMRATDRAEANARKLDEVAKRTTQLSTDFRLYSATLLVNQARSELRSVAQTSDNSQATRALRAALEDRLTKAEDFRDCVVKERSNCNVLIQQ